MTVDEAYFVDLLKPTDRRKVLLLHLYGQTYPRMVDVSTEVKSNLIFAYGRPKNILSINR